MTAGWLRQVVYGSARLGLFRVTSNALVSRNEGKPLPLWGKIMTGMFTGAAASFVGNPADLVSEYCYCSTSGLLALLCMRSGDDASRFRASLLKSSSSSPPLLCCALSSSRATASLLSDALHACRPSSVCNRIAPSRRHSGGITRASAMLCVE